MILYNQFYLILSLIIFVFSSSNYACSIPNPINADIYISDCTMGDGSSTLTLNANNSADTVFIDGTVTWDYTSVSLKNNVHVIISSGSVLNITGSLSIDATSSMEIIGSISGNISATNHGELILHNDHIFATLANHGDLYAQYDLEIQGSVSNSGNIKVGEKLTISGSASNYNAFIFAGDTAVVSGSFAHIGTVEHSYTFPVEDTFWDKFSNVDLPVELISFTGNLEEGQVNLEWATASEINSDYFEVQVSSDLKTWNSLKNISAAGNSTVVQRYSFSYKVNTDNIYFRLRQVDLDGKSKIFGPIQFVSNAKKELYMNIYILHYYKVEMN